MALMIGIDIGGTFTDIVELDTKTGIHNVIKVSSTPGNFAQGFFHGLDKIMEKTGASAGNVTRLVHGTTVSTNCVIEHKGSKLGILTTKGFEDVLIIGRGMRSDMYDLFYEPEAPTFLCDRQRIMGIRERLGSDGNVVTPLNENDVVEAVDFLVKEQEVQAIAVSYLFSFMDRTHERRTEQIIRERYPKMKVSLSSTINPMFREYERVCITCFNAYIGTEMESYIRSLEEGLRKRNMDVVLQVMQSRGGITNSEICIEKPVITLLSGPAAGVIGSVFIGKACERGNLISLDMGGTSCDVTLIKNQQPNLALEGRIDKYPLRQAMVDISTIGAGGGSIAWVDAANMLKVGPQSAGANPGPACYDRGSNEPTVTDASFVLGYLNPDTFGGGEISLKPELAKQAIQERLANQLGLDVYQTAAGIHRIVNNNMADQLCLASVYRAFHPKDFVLVAFGGAGPIAAGRLMELLSMKEIIVPMNPGVMSAFGLLVANIEHEEVGALLVPADEVDPKNITKEFARLETICEQKRDGVGITQTHLRILRSAEMRYSGQAYEIEVPFLEDESRITKEVVQNIVLRFHDFHKALHKHNIPDNPVEFVNLRVVYRQEPELVPELREIDFAPENDAIPKFYREAYFDDSQKFVETPVFERADLKAGHILKGPAIVEQADTTTVIYPYNVAKIDKFGNLIMEMING